MPKPKIDIERMMVIGLLTRQCRDKGVRVTDATLLVDLKLTDAEFACFLENMCISQGVHNFKTSQAEFINEGFDVASLVEYSKICKDYADDLSNVPI